MASIPTTSELYTGIKASLEAQLGVKINIFGRSFLNAIAMVQAAKLKLFWLFAASIQKNTWVDTADPIAQGGTLERFGEVKLNRSPFPAVQGVYDVDVTGVDAAVIPAGTVFISDDSSLSPENRFILDVEHVMSGTSGVISLRALTAGVVSKLDIGDTLTSSSPLLNVDDLVTVNTETTTPSDAEDIEDYRDAVIFAFQLEAQGGAATDYRIWSEDEQTVKAVFPYAKSGVCAEIDLYVEANADDSTDGKGTPSQATLDAVEEVVEFDPDTTKPDNERGRRPLGVRQINFLPVSVKDVTIVFNNPVNIDAATQSSIELALNADISDIRPFVDGADIPDNRNDILDVNRIIKTAQELLDATQKFDDITLEVDSTPVPTSITFTDGDIPSLESVTFV